MFVFLTFQLYYMDLFEFGLGEGLEFGSGDF